MVRTAEERRALQMIQEQNRDWRAARRRALAEAARWLEIASTDASNEPDRWTPAGQQWLKIAEKIQVIGESFTRGDDLLEVDRRLMAAR